VTQLPPDFSLALALLAPAGLIGWAALFSVWGVSRGPEWARGHLRRVVRVLSVLLVAVAGAAVFVRPLWAVFAVAYPLLIGLWLAWARSRQLQFLSNREGFGEVSDEFRQRVANRLGNGLVVSAFLALAMAAVLIYSGYWQGWIMVGLTAIALYAYSQTRRVVTTQ
jgi:hypothetical protein